MQSYPHDPHAFTEGLFWHDGFLYESTGEAGRSFIRKVDLASGRVLLQASIPAPTFGEGIALWGRVIVSLTWRDQMGWRWSLDRLQRLSAWHYAGEGWGLTSDGHSFIMSDGSAELRFLDPVTLRERRRLLVTAAGAPVVDINELEWVDGEILANIWRTDRIARIEPSTGHVVGWIDLTALHSQFGYTDENAVPNGIAWDARRRRLFVTGKNWPRLFQITPPKRAPSQRRLTRLIQQSYRCGALPSVPIAGKAISPKTRKRRGGCTLVALKLPIMGGHLPGSATSNRYGHSRRTVRPLRGSWQMAHIGYSWPTFDAMTCEIVRLIQPDRILDIGAGGGKYGNLLRAVVPNCALTALEYDKAAFQSLREAGYNNILPMLAADLYDRPADSYDVIIFGDVIEHMRHSEGRDLLEFLNYRARYILISTPECMPMSLPDFHAGHNSMWRPDAFTWHDYWAHQQSTLMHFYLLRGQLDWTAPPLHTIVDAINTSGLTNALPDDQTEPARLVIQDTRYVRAVEGTPGFLYRPA